MDSEELQSKTKMHNSINSKHLKTSADSALLTVTLHPAGQKSFSLVKLENSKIFVENYIKLYKIIIKKKKNV